MMFLTSKGSYCNREDVTNGTQFAFECFNELWGNAYMNEVTRQTY